MLLTLARDKQQPRPEQCTLGVLSVDGRGTFQTNERPWVPSTAGPAGMPDESCIAFGTYRMEPRETEARGKHWILSNPTLGVYRYPADVPFNSYGRSLVLMHAANWAHELLGCIAPGQARVRPLQLGNAFDEWMVSASRAAMDQIRMLLAAASDLQLLVTQ